MPRMVLKRAARRARFGADVRAACMERHVQPRRHVTDEFGIARALALARVVVEVGGLHAVAEHGKHVQQRGGIGTPGHGGDHALSRFEQRIAHNGGVDSVKQAVVCTLH